MTTTPDTLSPQQQAEARKAPFNRIANLGDFATPGHPAQNKLGGGMVAFRHRCREFMDAEGWAKLEGMARNGSRPDAQHRALELIAAYAYGRPSQRHEVLVDDTGARSLVDGLTQLMAEDLARRRLAERGAVVEGEVVKNAIPQSFTSE